MKKGFATPLAQAIWGCIERGDDDAKQLSGLLVLAACEGLPVINENHNRVLLLSRAAFLGRKECVKTLLSHGANVNLANEYDGMTPLFAAAQHGYSEIVRMLLDAGSSPGAADRDGTTVLHRVVQMHASNEVLRMLIDAGADIHARDARGTDAILMAVRVRNVPAAELLLERGAVVSHDCIDTAMGQHLHGAPSDMLELLRGAMLAPSEPPAELR